jgi:phage gp29-like protein
MKKIENPQNSLSKVPQMTWTDRTKKDLATWKTALQMAESPINPDRFLLQSLYADSILDPHLASVLSKRILAVTNTKLVFSEEEGEDNETVETIIESQAFEKILVEILNSKFYGHSLIQTDLVNLKSELIDRRYVKPEKNIVVAHYSDETGENYTENPYRNVCISVGDAKNLGLLLIASQYVILKKGNVADWATFNERYATPFRYTTLPSGATQKEVNDSKTQLAEMGANGYGVFPKGSEMQFVESKSSGNNTNYENFADFCNAEMSKLFLGQTMTTENGSSMSQAKVHKEVEDKISRSDKQFVEKILNTEVRRLLIAQGIIPETSKAFFQFRDEDEEMSLKEQSDIWFAANAIAPIDKHEFSERFGVVFSKEAPETKPEKEKEEKQEKKKTELGMLNKLLTKLGFFQSPPSQQQ